MRRRAFALVIVLFLVAMMAVGGTALGLLSSTESILCRHAGSDLDHRLAVESLLVVLPKLAQRPKDGPPATGERPGDEVIELAVGDVFIGGVMRSESTKRGIGDQAPEQLRSELRSLAQDHQLDAEGVRIQPARNWPDEKNNKLRHFVWFDQVIEQRHFEDVFPWDLPNSPKPEGESRRHWSDLLTFWLGGDVRSLIVETRLGSDVRRWFLVIRMNGQSVEVLNRTRI